jgi:hypothetical protein
MVAASAAAELGAEVRALNLIVLVDVPPRGIADSSGDVDFQLQYRHGTRFEWGEASGAKAQFVQRC